MFHVFGIYFLQVALLFPSKFLQEGPVSSDLYSDSEASGSESEELSDDGSFEDDEEYDGTEDSDADFDEELEHASNGSGAETGEDSEDEEYDYEVVFSTS